MKDIIVKILRVILWIVGLPIIVIILGVFMWITCLIDFINE
jgi:hypothetical protein